MTMHSALPRRFTAPSLIALIALLGVSPAQAFYNNQLHPGAYAPWTVYLNNDSTTSGCSGAQITESIIVTTGTCATSYNQPEAGTRKAIYYPISNFSMRNDAKVFTFDGRTSNASIGNIGVLVTPEPHNFYLPHFAKLLSYKDEKRALVEGDEALTQGAFFTLYGATLGVRRGRTAETSQRYVDVQRPAQEARRLVYRSVQKYRELEPQRFALGAANPLADPKDLESLFGIFDTYRELNNAVLLTTGLDSDPANGIGSPVSPRDHSGSVLYDDGKDLALIGLITSEKMQARLSYYWPWIYQLILRNAPRAEAIEFAHTVLGTGAWGSDGRRGTLGDMYVYDNPVSGEVEFFKLIGLNADGTYWYFPTNKGNNSYWQYRGTELPTLEQATTAIP